MFLSNKEGCPELNGCGVTQPKITRLFSVLSLSEHRDVLHNAMQLLLTEEENSLGEPTLLMKI